ncbi:MAG: FAD binding domain-containing protein [Planctomycetes bacterium]|nr:FAD binding domain-containing protein [Planctomycetota bacterium]
MTASRGRRRQVEVFSPGSVLEAVQMLTELREPVDILAGGTDLMAQVEAGHRDLAKVVLDLSRLDDLRGIELDGDEIRIGAMTTYAQILDSDQLAQDTPSLLAAAITVGGPQIRNQGTIGGNLMNGSPAADLVPPLLAVGGFAVLTSNEGQRKVPVFSFYLGYRKPVARAGELLTEVRVPRKPPGAVDYFRKVAPRRAQAISKLVLAGRAWGAVDDAGVRRVEELRLGVGAVGPTPARLFETERFLSGRRLDDAAIRDAIRVMQSEIQPWDDHRSTEVYRRRVAGNLLREFAGRL